MRLCLGNSLHIDLELCAPHTERRNFQKEIVDILKDVDDLALLHPGDTQTVGTSQNVHSAWYPQLRRSMYQ